MTKSDLTSEREKQDLRLTIRLGSMMTVAVVVVAALVRLL